MQWNLNDSIFTEVMVQYDEQLCNVNISSVQTIQSNEWHAAILFLGQKLTRADEEGEHVWESLHDLELSSISLQSLNSFRLPCYALSFGTVCVSAFADFSTCRVPEPRRYCKIRTLGYSYGGCQTTSTQIMTNSSKFLQVFLSKRLQHVLQSWWLV